MAAWVPTGRAEGRAPSGTTAICSEQFSASAMPRPRQAPGPARHVELFASQLCSWSKPAAAELVPAYQDGGAGSRAGAVVGGVQSLGPRPHRAVREQGDLAPRCSPPRWRSPADRRQERQGRDLTTSVMARYCGDIMPSVTVTSRQYHAIVDGARVVLKPRPVVLGASAVQRKSPESMRRPRRQARPELRCGQSRRSRSLRRAGRRSERFSC